MNEKSNWDKIVEAGAKAKEAITRAVAKGALRACREPWKAAVALMVSHAVVLFVGAALF
jgi:hypothetical protein